MKLIALYKAFRGGEWFAKSLESISCCVDGVVVVLSDESWVGGPLRNNCVEIIRSWDAIRPGWIRSLWLETPRQEEQYRAGLAKIREEFGEEAAVLIVDTDEVWTHRSLANLAREIEDNPKSHYFTGRILTYVRSPLYEVYPSETGHPVVALQSAKPQPIKVRFQDRSAGPTKDCPDVWFHHFPYVRENQDEIVAKFNATSSQETVASNGKWLETVWPRLPMGSNLHMTPGAERCWPGIKVLPESPVALPGFCQEIQKAEDARWRDMIAVEPAETTIHAAPSEDDAAKYPEFAELAPDVALLRKRLKMTYLESLVLHREAASVPHNGEILEIGSGDGGSMAVMALASKAALWAVDPFVPYDEEARTLVRGVMEGNEGRFWETAEQYGYAGRVRHLKKNSDRAASLCPDSTFDLILVDGNHSEVIALSDMQLYWPKVKPGGTMLIHDYTTRFPGVIRACQRWGVPYRVFAGTSLAYARKPA